MAGTAYNRILLKLSGESLKGDRAFGTDQRTLDYLAEQIAVARAMKCDVAIVVGGGNFVRGKDYEEIGMDRATADYAGMMATVINGLIVQNALINSGIEVRTLSAITINRVAEPFVTRRALRHLEKGRVVVFVAGTGNPFMSTDTAAALRALEIKADVLLLAKHGVDGVYDTDPRYNDSAKRIPTLTARKFIKMELEVMDPTAVTLCMENKMPMIVFDIFKKNSLRTILEGGKVGTRVTVDETHIQHDGRPG